MSYNKPFAEEIETNEICEYGCGTVAKYRFKKGNLCCSKHFNSCAGKRKLFSKTQNHKLNAIKSLETRLNLGITKTSQIKGAKTRKSIGHYEKLSKKMKEHWSHNPWNNNLQCPLITFKNTDILYQGSFEYNFLEKLENKKGINWLIENVKRGPSIWYKDPIDDTERLYISDFLIGNTIYEIKSQWTWNRHGKDMNLESKNKIKLKTCVEHGYNVILVLNGEEINATNLD